VFCAVDAVVAELAEAAVDELQREGFAHGLPICLLEVVSYLDAVVVLLSDFDIQPRIDVMVGEEHVL